LGLELRFRVGVRAWVWFRIRAIVRGGVSGQGYVCGVKVMTYECDSNSDTSLYSYLHPYLYLTIILTLTQTLTLNLTLTLTLTLTLIPILTLP
jgi:hypothetical protein